MATRLTELYDEQFGGFGVEPKQPPWEALQFLCGRFGLTGERVLLEMVETSLQGMWHGIYDRKDQGFFRYSVSRDWKVPHYEKMLVSNASLAILYLDGLLITRKAVYRKASEGIMDYLLTTLYSSQDGLFFASQDADEPFYQQSWKDRDKLTPPPIDRTYYAGWNALSATALIKASNVLGIRAYLQTATEVLRRLWKESWTSSGGLQRRVGELHDSTPILADQVDFLRAWLALYQTTGRNGSLWCEHMKWPRRRSGCSAPPTEGATIPRRRKRSRQRCFRENSR